jgi:L-asparaginase II
MRAATSPPPPPYSTLQHNCSGKHAGMLAYCVLHGHSTGRTISRTSTRCSRPFVGRWPPSTGVSEDRLVAGTDGCSAPNYAIPLASLATAFARLATRGRRSRLRPAPRTLADAMIAHPEMVSAASVGATSR